MCVVVVCLLEFLFCFSFMLVFTFPRGVLMKPMFHFVCVCVCVCAHAFCRNSWERTFLNWPIQKTRVYFETVCSRCEFVCLFVSVCTYTHLSLSLSLSQRYLSHSSSFHTWFSP